MTVLEKEISKNKEQIDQRKLKFIDLFAGMGGIRLGLEQAANSKNIKVECILTSEIKPTAIESLKYNFDHKILTGDINEVKTENFEDFDILLAGFPCQAFSYAGKQRGFMDTRGTLFFQIERILREKIDEGKKIKGFILENVEGFVKHDKGNTYRTVVGKLEELGYVITAKVLDSKDFGIPQSRKRIYILGVDQDNYHPVNIEGYEHKIVPFKKIMQKRQPVVNNNFTKALLKVFKPSQLYGKCIKDKRGGKKNIHSWDFGLKGTVTEEQKMLLNMLFKERRKRHWAEKIGIDWMDGMPLTIDQIKTFFDVPNLQEILDDLVYKKYLVLEHPKEKIKSEKDGNVSYERIPDLTKPKGYNIVAGKLSYGFSQFLDPNTYTPTMVAMDMSKIGVVEKSGIRHLTLREGLRLFGYPDTYKLDFLENEKGKHKGFDLLGNSVCVPVIKAVAERLIESLIKPKINEG